MTKTLLSLVIAATLCGCGKSDSATGDKTPADPKADKQAAEPPAAKLAPDFSAWDVEGKKKAWQGSWVVKDNGTFQAWTVTGDKVDTWDGTTDKSFTLAVEAPCRAWFADDKGMRYPHEFSVTDGKLRSRPGGAGYKNGAEAIFCDPAGDLYTVDASGKCSLWKDKFGEWSKIDGDCGFKKDAQGAEVFFHKGANEGEFAVEGTAILSKVSADTEAAADHAAAKTAAAAKAAAK